MSNYPDPDEFNDDFEDIPFDYDEDGWHAPRDVLGGGWGTDDAPLGFDDR